ncbi:MAG: class III extradiol ring-cleavage dioxygenase [Porticoccaceae bacterium]
MLLSPNVLFLSHGGGPLPLLGDAAHADMLTLIEHIRQRIEKPRAIILVSAHWEEPVATLTSGANPELFYDYYGFPPESYEITYPAPGEPELAVKIHASLQAAGIEAALDPQRGFDHGLFVPLKLLVPEADVPCVELSLLRSLDPAQHIRLGRALAAHAGKDALVIGSGFTFHNMRAFFASPPDQANALNREFDAWLTETMCSTELSESEREQRLIHWEQAPGARFSHPREEHLLPLHVCYGAAGGPPREAWTIDVIGKRTGFYLW